MYIGPEFDNGRDGSPSKNGAAANSAGDRSQGARGSASSGEWAGGHGGLEPGPSIR